MNSMNYYQPYEKTKLSAVPWAIRPYEFFPCYDQQGRPLLARGFSCSTGCGNRSQG